MTAKEIKVISGIIRNNINNQQLAQYLLDATRDCETPNAAASRLMEVQSEILSLIRLIIKER